MRGPGVDANVFDQATGDLSTGDVGHRCPPRPRMLAAHTRSLGLALLSSVSKVPKRPFTMMASESYGSWSSPITASYITSSSVGLGSQRM